MNAKVPRKHARGGLKHAARIKWGKQVYAQARLADAERPDVQVVHVCVRRLECTRTTREMYL